MKPVSGWRLPRGSIQAWARAGIATVLLVLGSCGVDIAGVGGEGTGTFASGRIDGFGSVVVAGRTFDDRDAVVSLEVDPRAPEAIALTALRLGMVARLEGTGDRLASIRVAPLLRAPIADLDLARGRFVAAGQEVQVDATPSEPTALEGWATASELREGDHVDVHGERDAQGVIRASLLVRLPQEAGIRVTGALRALPGRTGRWAIQGLEVDASRAMVLPAGRAPASGDLAVAYSAGESAGVLVADVIALQPPQAAERAADGVDRVANVSGVVHAVAGDRSFVLAGIEVDARSARFEGGQAGDLQPGRRVEVEGVLRGVHLLARSVRLVSPSEAPVARVRAAIGNLAGAGGFTVRGNAVEAGTARFSGLVPENLTNGLPVRVTGAWAGRSVRATSVERAPLAEGDGLALAGLVTGYDPARRTFGLEGVALPLELQATTAFVGGRPGDFGDGVRVVARGQLSLGVLRVQELRWAQADAVLEVAGRAGNVEATPSGGEFEIGPTDFIWTSATVFRGSTGTSADLIEGQVIRVRGIVEGGVVRAIEVDARDTQPGQLRLRGTLTPVDGSDPSLLRLDGQRVDASGAVFDPPQLRDRPAGAYVDVEGVLVDGVVRAVRISDP